MTPLEKEDAEVIEQLGRARQRIAELERELDKALEQRREWMEKVTSARQRIAELEGHLRIRKLES